jgi:hypothetical protein
MKEETEIRNKFIQLAIRWFFVVLPTAIIGYITLRYVNFSYTSFTAGILGQSLYFASGLLLAYSLYYFRARWIVTFLLLWFTYWLIGRIIVKLPGEFDVFYATAKFQLYSALFIFGWVFGFLLARVKYSYIILFGVLAVTTLVAISNTIDISLSYILLHLVPVVVYGLYMLFLSPLLTERIEMDVKKSGRLFIRFGLFVLLVLLAFIFVQKIFSDDLIAVEKELEARGLKEDKNAREKMDGSYDERFGLMQKDGKDDGYRLKDSMRVNSKMSQSDRLMFCSKLDNYFPDGNPKPLYFIYHYLTRYDPVKETFTRDIGVPYFDEFEMDPSELEMYHSKEDTSVIRKSLGNKKRIVVDAEVYLSSSTWKHALLAPATAFYVQTIPVEKDFQKTFISAYKVKAYASDLNNAFYVYNPSANPMLEDYQEERFEELRNVEGYRGLDSAFYHYYTQVPNGPLYDSITKLSRSLVKDSALPVDKVLAVRDHFLQRDEEGKRIFRYTLKPGGVDDPNIPNASMIQNFLFKTHAGYCTYYAGASLLMLRSMGIPARFTTGFATINRSDKNKGWYWFYASQAHAWTQVYFPGYGWMDFDMTIGNEDQQSAPRPDGTPPLPPPQPWLVLNATAATSPDVAKKNLDVSFSNLIYFDEAYDLDKPVTRTIDASICRILYDKVDTTLEAIHAGDSIIVVSYKDEGRVIPQPRKGVSIESQLASFPVPIIADEVHIKPKGKTRKDEPLTKKKTEQEEKGMTWQEMIKLGAQIAVGAILIIFLLPLLILIYLLIRSAFASDPASKADQIYRAALYRFHMAGVERGSETPLEYARMKVDPTFSAGFEEFMHVYLRLKYGPGTLLTGDKEIINKFAASYGASINKRAGFFRIILNYFNLLLAGRYFFRSEKIELQNQTSL